MTIEEQLKNEILNNYKSIRAFTQKIDIPYSTLDTIFKRGIGGAGVNTVLKIFNELSLDIKSIDKGVLTPNNSNNNPVLNANEKKLISSYRSLNNQGKQKLLDYSNDLICSGNYGENIYKIKTAARDGSFKETTVTDDDLQRLMDLPDVDDLK